MPRPIGPTIPRWQLGEQLSRLRDRARMSQGQIAERLGCSVSKIQKIEAGEVGVVKAELEAMLTAYDLTDERMREELFELQKLGKQRGWWSKFGAVPTPFATFLGLESAATRIKVFEPMVVHGLLQTEEYARAIAGTVALTSDEDQRERQVRIRMERQGMVFAEDPPEIWVILDEAVLHRQIGGPHVMAAQLRHLLKLSPSVTVQVVPFESGGYPGTLGAMTIFEFDDHMHTPVVYVEGQAGNLYLEREDDLRRCNVAYNHMSASALSKQESHKRIAAVADQHEQSGRSER
ncbi:helix-turn-helix domain-containing protein [Phytohabitans rumicis]|uniref:Transcriptional regulator n=1 Tax=Phytohabitans rumicis TaxID=1076125 RepID=A0A6V8LB38_9ACTN|nr:helix-turn-helix transcriptional regulator [Phytohabitans rumicis]GFJ92238.1 transcriptional regulator [Phytohabitans rumicis]